MHSGILVAASFFRDPTSWRFIRAVDSLPLTKRVSFRTWPSVEMTCCEQSRKHRSNQIASSVQECSIHSSICRITHNLSTTYTRSVAQTEHVVIVLFLDLDG